MSKFSVYRKRVITGKFLDEIKVLEQKVKFYEGEIVQALRMASIYNAPSVTIDTLKEMQEQAHLELEEKKQEFENFKIEGK